ncbi:MAG: PH domain-containing protein [Patescibacteria group bacterium]|nr:PH domain-containing protein [Patescibacteria group bacterium]
MKINLESGERLVTVIRKHWIVMVGFLCGIALCAIAPYVLLRLVPAGLFTNIPAATAGPVLAFFYLLWLLALWMILFVKWTSFYLDVWIVTDERLINIDQVGLFRRDVSTTWLEKLQDVEVDVHGLFQTLFGFGTIKIFTAGEDPHILITNAAHPDLARRALLRSEQDAEDEALHKTISNMPGSR